MSSGLLGLAERIDVIGILFFWQGDDFEMIWRQLIVVGDHRGTRIKHLPCLLMENTSDGNVQ